MDRYVVSQLAGYRLGVDTEPNDHEFNLGQQMVLPAIKPNSVIELESKPPITLSEGVELYLSYWGKGDLSPSTLRAYEKTFRSIRGSSFFQSLLILYLAPRLNKLRFSDTRFPQFFEVLMNGMGPERRLLAILTADVAGYSRLMGQDHGGTVEALILGLLR